jgi:diguanylate cyclase (GGDEF)-like protein
MNVKNTILIVDDSPANIQSLAGVLKEDYKLKVANSGARALEILDEDETIDLILLDVIMPKMDGYIVLKKLKENSKTATIPVIFVTGNDSVEDEEKGLEAGVVDYITKPIRPAIVKARVKIHMTIKTQRDTLQYNAMHDMLTGLYNRHHLDAEGARKFAKALRHGSDFSVIMADIDHFKNINDTHGHITGDIVLKAIADVFSKSNRIEDFVARFGGEEFVILLEDCDANDAKEKAESFRKRVEALHPAGIKVTSSFGLTNISPMYTSLEEMLKDADTALYKAKESGRNKVICYSLGLKGETRSLC